MHIDSIKQYVLYYYYKGAYSNNLSPISVIKIEDADFIKHLVNVH